MVGKKKRKEKIRATRRKKATSPIFPMSNPILHIRIFRFNPQLDFTPRTHEYSITPRKNETILDLLTRIKHTQDGSLTFRGSCNAGTCGGCGVRVNGKPVLACSTKVSSISDGHPSLRIDPLVESRVIKDLVMDEKEFFDDLLHVTPWLVSRKNDERRNHKMGMKDVKRLGFSHACTLCGLCDSHTRSTSEKINPAAFVKAYRYIHDVRDGNTQRLSSLSSYFSSSALAPVSESDSICPENISPREKMIELHSTLYSTKPFSSFTKMDR